MSGYISTLVIATINVMLFAFSLLLSFDINAWVLFYGAVYCVGMWVGMWVGVKIREHAERDR